MRLHRLTVTAFGPFAGTEEVDLDSLADHGLFLINGPTGSGKTSLLDAVCFALYGDVPGARTKGSLHSDHAPADRVPEVTLEWSVGARRFRIVRSPEFYRPKKRGTGLTKEQHKVVLTELVDGAWADRGSGRADEVGTIVRETVGLDLQQFATIVLLPQGEFARFLRSSTEDRAAILQRLFDTGRFEQVQRWLEGRRRDAEATVAGARRDLHALLTRVDDAARQAWSVLPEDADEPAERGRVEVDETDPEVLLPALDALVAAVEEVAAGAERQAATAESEREDAARHEEAGRRTAALRRKATAAEAAVEALQSRAALVDEARSRFEAAVAAAALMPYVDAASRTAARSAQAQSALTRTVAGLPAGLRDALGLGEDRQEVDAGVLRTVGAAVDDCAERSVRLADEFRRARQSEDDLAAVTAAVRTRLADATAAEEAVERAETTLSELTEAAGDLATRAADAEPARLRAESLDGVVRLIQQVAADDHLVDRARGAAEGATETRDDHQRVVTELLRRRAAGLAAELATGLTAGVPCPVCGSADHPSPAQAAPDEVVSREAVEEAETALSAAVDRRTHALTALGAAEATRSAHDTDLAQRLGALEISAAGDVPALVREARAAQRAAAAAATELEALARRRQSAEQALQRAGAAGQQAQQDLADARARVDLTRGRSVADHAAVRRTLSELLSEPVLGLDELPVGHEVEADGPTTSPLPDAEVLDTVSGRIRACREALVQLREAQDEALRADAESRRAIEELDTHLTGSDFASAQDVVSAHLPEPERASLDQSIRRHDQTLAEAQVVLTDPEVLAARREEEPDLAALATLAEATGAAARRASGRAGVAGQALVMLLRHVAETSRMLATLGPAVQEAQVIREVADAVAGVGANNLKKMSLPTYVLAARLEEVVELANERLRVMTDGRYELRHTDERAARGARSGLGLEVVDGWSGRARDTATLSGGETFMASLALALGLGDAVRAEAGGIDLDTLFVDEGFGTLDEAALDQVMDVLDGLREGGRSVGIISHVTELRQRIPAQVRLTRTQQGSTVQVVTQVSEV